MITSSRLLFQFKNMWKFLPGVSKPEFKRKVDTRESNKAYDATKRKTTFHSYWHNICTSHSTFKTYSEFLWGEGGKACPQTSLEDLGHKATLTANTGLHIFLQG